MDENENVVFDNTKPSQPSQDNPAAESPSLPGTQKPQAPQSQEMTLEQGEGSAPPPPGGTPPPDVPTQPDSIESDDTSQVDAGAEQVETGSDQIGAGGSGISGILGSGLVKKIIIGVVIFLVLIFIVFLIIPKRQAVKNVKLAWWGLWEDSRVVQTLIDDFHRKNPNITVEYIKQDPEQYRSRLITRAKQGSGPDVFRYHNTWVPMFSDVLLPLPADVIKPGEFKKNYYPVMQKDLVQNGAIYGIPLEADTLALFVNTELFKSKGLDVPQNWTDFLKAARALTVKSDGKIKTAGAALGTFGNITHAPDIISLVFTQQGVDMKKFTDPSEQNKKNKSVALEFYTSFTIGDQNVWDSTLDESILAFSRGNLAMYFGYSWDVFKIQALNKNLEFKVYSVPGLEGGRNKTIASYWVEGASSKSRNQKEALLFMQYLAQKETAQRFYSEQAKTRAFGEPYARVDLQASLKDNKLVYPFVSQLNNSSSSLFSSDTHDGDDGLNFLSNNYLGNAINSIVNDNSSIESVVDALNQGVSQVLQKYGQQ